MTTQPPSDLNAADLIARIRRGEVADDFLSFAARGLLPIEQEGLVAVLAVLSNHANPEIAGNARASLTELPLKVRLTVARDDRLDSATLAAFMHASEEDSVLEELIRNRTVHDDAVMDLARRASQHLQEIIVINQERILRTPAILDALLENPNLSGDARRRALETREEFFEKRSRIEAALAAMEDETIALDPIADLLEAAERAEAEGKGENTLAMPEGETDMEEMSVWLKILSMTVSERVRCAFRGGMTERAILIRDRNRLVCTAVIKSPRITDSEVEAIALMRNVEDEVLRLITMNRTWMQKYPIVLNLARNPKTPVGVVLPLINRLTLRDLKNLTGDRNVPEVVRTTARKLYAQRKQN